MNRRQFSAALALGLGAPARRYLSAVTPDTDQISEAPNTEKVRIQVAPTSVPEWDHEDEASSVLGGPELHKASDDEAQRMLDQMTLELPAALDWVELVHYAQQHRIVGGLQIPPDSAHCSFYVFEAPLSIILTGGQRLVRLRLNLDLRAQNPERGEVVAYDVFPPSDVDVKELASGELNLDISKALQFVLTASERRQEWLQQTTEALLIGGEQSVDGRLHCGCRKRDGRKRNAIKVKGKPLIEYCDVSYGQTLGMFLQIHRDTPQPAPASLAAVFDEQGTVAYQGTFRMLDAPGFGTVSMLPTSSWDDVRAALAGQLPSDLLFACHGEYNREDPANSLLRLRSGLEVPFSEVFSKLDLTGCRSVTLGACESGIARTLVSAEYIGLPVAFLAAGAQYVIATLWQVHQIATAILLGHHYRLLGNRKHTVVSALNEAQRLTMKMSQTEVIHWLTEFLPREKAGRLETEIRKMGDPPFSHPYYWAGFYIAGDV